MKNFLLVLVSLLALAVPAKAQSYTSAQATWNTVRYTTLCSSTTIGVTAVEMTSNTSTVTTSVGISQLKVTNAHTTATICCASASTVTCNTGAATDGEAIAPVASGQRNFLSWGISTSQQFWCIATVASTGVTVCKVR